jgi:hypothetical protein
MNNMPRYLTFAPDITVDESSGLPTGFSGIAYSGGVVPNFGWYGNSAIDIGSRVYTGPNVCLGQS